MNTILKISEVLKGFGEHLINNGTLKQGYADLLALLTVAAICSILYTLFERRIEQ